MISAGDSGADPCAHDKYCDHRRHCFCPLGERRNNKYVMERPLRAHDISERHSGGLGQALLLQSSEVYTGGSSRPFPGYKLPFAGAVMFLINLNSGFLRGYRDYGH